MNRLNRDQGSQRRDCPARYSVVPECQDCFGSRWRDSNPRPDDYKSPALPDCATPAWKSKVSENRLVSICRLRRMSESSQPHHSASPPGSHYQPALSVVLIIVVLFVAAAFLMLRYVNPASSS